MKIIFLFLSLFSVIYSDPDPYQQGFADALKFVAPPPGSQINPSPLDWYHLDKRRMFPDMTRIQW